MSLENIVRKALFRTAMLALPFIPSLGRGQPVITQATGLEGHQDYKVERVKGRATLDTLAQRLKEEHPKIFFLDASKSWPFALDRNKVYDDALKHCVSFDEIINYRLRAGEEEKKKSVSEFEVSAACGDSTVVITPTYRPDGGFFAKTIKRLFGIKDLREAYIIGGENSQVIIARANREFLESNGISREEVEQTNNEILDEVIMLVDSIRNDVSKQKTQYNSLQDRIRYWQSKIDSLQSVVEGLNTLARSADSTASDASQRANAALEAVNELRSKVDSLENKLKEGKFKVNYLLVLPDGTPIHISEGSLFGTVYLDFSNALGAADERGFNVGGQLTYPFNRNFAGIIEANYWNTKEEEENLKGIDKNGVESKMGLAGFSSLGNNQFSFSILGGLEKSGLYGKIPVRGEAYLPVREQRTDREWEIRFGGHFDLANKRAWEIIAGMIFSGYYAHITGSSGNLPWEKESYGNSMRVAVYSTVPEFKLFGGLSMGGPPNILVGPYFEVNEKNGTTYVINQEVHNRVRETEAGGSILFRNNRGVMGKVAIGYHTIETEAGSRRVPKVKATIFVPYLVWGENQNK